MSDPDGYKDTPADRRGPRDRLAASLDAIFEKSFPHDLIRDAVEPKLFGLGSESYVVGSHEFYLGYAITRKKVLCLDAGHYHPTENLADKLSALFLWLGEVLLHVSRGVRWDSDHVVTLTDELQALAHELVRGGFLDRTRLGLDYFDASINRVAAWVIGAATCKKRCLSPSLNPPPRCENLKPPATTLPDWRCSKNAKRSPSAPSGINSASPRAPPSPEPGCPSSKSTSETFSPNAAENPGGGAAQSRLRSDS